MSRFSRPFEEEREHDGEDGKGGKGKGGGSKGKQQQQQQPQDVIPQIVRDLVSGRFLWGDGLIRGECT